MQLLFQRDNNPGVDRSYIERFARDRLRDETLREFCLQLYDGVTGNHEDIDRRLREAADNWRLERMAAVDRNILRLGAFELMYLADTPDAVAFDEAIELARRYGAIDSSSFVNGVLDRMRRESVSSPSEPSSAAST